ncbi:MAG TPA: sigma-70 family RNA polymerase sigma factor [Puia sp.]|nr:sigma-70 family RNA polymerase sigma factor [Puia sp.]
MELSADIRSLADRLFRQESGRLVALLTRIFGTENLQTAEDVVQQTFLQALDHWRSGNIPDNPSGWLFQVARNKAIDVLRKNRHSNQYDFSDDGRVLLKSEYTLEVTIDNLFKEELVRDDQLRMMFVCCQPGISQENQMTLILKTLCGFSAQEIAKAFLTSEDTIYKRLYRTREFFRQHKVPFTIPSADELKSRTRTVLSAIYLLFNEGYYSTTSEQLIRFDLIFEAMTLCRLLTESQHTYLPEVFALMAQMCFHAARSESRLSKEGEIILLPDQNRSLWDRSLIASGYDYMIRASFGNAITSYHIEAAIAYEHCKAPSYSETNWKLILDYYSWICIYYPSPIAELNRVVAVLQVEGPNPALEEIEKIKSNKQLESYYLFYSILGEIYQKLQNRSQAVKCLEKAIGLAPSELEKKVLRKKLDQA